MLGSKPSAAAWFQSEEDVAYSGDILSQWELHFEN